MGRHGQRAEEKPGADRVACGQSSRSVDVPLPHPRAPRDGDDGSLRSRALSFLSRAEARAGSASRNFDVVVIGAGQAGLAIGYFLARQGRRFLIIDAANSVGSAWRGRWDSLRLFTPRRYDSLPGLAFPGDSDGYPTRDEAVAYLELYAKTFDLPIELNSVVRKLAAENGKYFLESDGETIAADQVVVATGPFQTPNVPTIAGDLAPGVFQAHSTDYRRPDDVPKGRILVVGGGNTGFQIAKELSKTHEVQLAIGSRQTPLPQRILGRDLFWWLKKAGLLRTSVDSRIGRRAQHRDTLIGSSRRELKRRYGVELKPRLVGMDERTARFADGTESEVDGVIWATGYEADYSWIDFPVFDADGVVRHKRGATDVPDLYFLGLTWQHTRGSALLGWVTEDAEFIAEQISQRVEAKARAAAP